jgi:hypothetical protein
MHAGLDEFIHLLMHMCLCALDVHKSCSQDQRRANLHKCHGAPG